MSRSPDRAAAFEAFYQRSREQLLLETFALTGDLSASRVAVRDAFSHAWQHWRTVARHDDPEAWLRPVAWSRAQRRHTTRIWHRDKGIPDPVRATLDALGKLPGDQRKALVLTQLSTLGLGDIGRLVGQTRDAVERDLQTASSQFSLHREVPSTAVRQHLEQLRPLCADTRWPRAPIVQRTGTQRRRSHTVAGVAVMAAALVLSGSLVHTGRATTTSLHDEPVLTTPRLVAERPEPISLEPDRLLDVDQLRRVDPSLRWRAGETNDNTEGDGIVLPCQRERYADPRGRDAMVRGYTGLPRRQKGRGRPAPSTATEFVELSRTPAAAEKAFRRAVAWFAGCTDPRTRLERARAVRDVGEEAIQLELTRWTRGAGVLTVGVARTGRMVVTTVASTPEGDPESPTLLAAAVNGLCGAPGAGACAGVPRARTVPVPPAGPTPGMLIEADLPVVDGAPGPWIGTEPQRARTNPAATACDKTSFAGLPAARTRTFVFPREKRDTEFGLTETAAAATGREAGRLMSDIRRKVAACARRDLGTEVTGLARMSKGQAEMQAWRFDVEVSDQRTVSYLMAILRRGGKVAQIGFTPSRDLRISQGDFVAVARRGLERLPHHGRR